MTAMKALEELEQMKKQIETVETFLRSNPFLKDIVALGDTVEDLDGRASDYTKQDKIFTVHLERNDTYVIFYTNRNDGNIKGLLPAPDSLEVSFAPTDTEVVVNFLLECGYLNGHEVMDALAAKGE